MIDDKFKSTLVAFMERVTPEIVHTTEIELTM
jgi:hypothetical protein